MNSPSCQIKCKEYDNLKAKQNYERLIVIQKKHLDQNKDKEYAVNIQLEELRRGYETTKNENVILQDNLETQNKLWKIWLDKFDANPAKVDSTPKSNEEPVKQPEDDEALLIEDDDNLEGNEDVTDQIFEEYMKNVRKSSFKRTSPAEESVPVNGKSFTCGKCTFKTGEENRLKEHMKNAHSQNLRNGNNGPKIGFNSGQNRNKLQFCHYWNNLGSCHFESKNGRPCKFEHKTAPTCSFDGSCNRKFCMYVHKKQNLDFLANAPRNFGPPMMQMPHWGAPPPWMKQKTELKTTKRGGGGSF